MGDPQRSLALFSTMVNGCASHGEARHSTGLGLAAEEL